MINIDSRLLEKLNGDELAVFCHVLKRIGKKNESFPSKKLLMEETGYGRDRIVNAIKSLRDKKIISAKQKKDGGKFSYTVYRVLISGAGVYVNAKDETLEDRDTGFRTTDIPCSEKQPLSIKQEEEVLIKGKVQKTNSSNDYSDFYRNEIVKAQKADNKRYIVLVETLYGKNEMDSKLTQVLSLKKQLSFKEFLSLEEFKKSNPFRYKDYLVKMENYKPLSKNSVCLSATLRNWIRMDKKR